MSRTNGEGRLKKRRNCCLTCSIVCFIFLVIFFVALYVGGSIMFKTYVSPHIGGLELNDAIALASNVLSGKEAKTAYTEADLDSFYSGLSDAMFLSDKTEDELEYELVPDEQRAALAASYSPLAAAEEESSEDSSYDEDAAYAAFCRKLPSDRYALIPEATRALISLEEFSALAADTDAAAAARKKVGLKTYRLSIDSIMKDMDFGAKDFDASKALEKSLSSLEFNFDSLAEYDITDPDADQNQKFTTFSVNGKQASAFINDVIAYLLEAEGSPLTSALKDTIPEEIPLADYVKVASVTIKNIPLATSEGEAVYDQKDTALDVTISIKLRDLVKAALKTDELKSKLSSVPSFAMKLIPSLVPKFFSSTITVYPLADKEDGREIVVTLNKPSKKNAKRLATLMNALLGKEDSDSTKTFFGTVNDKVVSAFTSINKTVKINFIASKDADGKPLKDGKGNTYSEMSIMTWQTVLSLIDKDGKLSAHDMLTMLKCLYISTDPHGEIKTTDAAMSTFKTEMANKYGVDNEYLQTVNLFSTEDLKALAEHIDLANTDLKADNSEMKPDLTAEALAAFMKNYVTGSNESSSASAAESDDSSLLKGMDLKICDVTIDRDAEASTTSKAIYTFELGLLADVSQLLDDKLPTDGIGGTLSKKLLPKGDSYLCVMLYIAEYEEEGKLVHKVGKNIDNPAEGETSAYLSKIRINDFSYDETKQVFDALNTFMQVLSDTTFEMSSVTAQIEDAVNDVFDTVAKNDYSIDICLRAKNGSLADDRGGMVLPSLYEILESFVKPKLKSGETFSTTDARDVLLQVYQPKKINADFNKDTYYDESQAVDFVDEINDKYYIKKASALTVTDLFGSGASDLSTKIKADSIYFKYDATEAALWTDHEKHSLYGDTRTVDELRIKLTGTMVAALVKESNMVPSDVAEDFGTLEVLGAKFESADNKTYLTFDLKLTKGEDSSMKFGGALPSDIKLSAKILLYAPSYTEEAPRYSARIIINDAASEKAFILLRSVGGDTLSEESIANKISESLSTTFNTLEGKIPLFYSDGGTPYMSGTEECILISDVFSFLIKETNMTDLDSEATDPSDLAARLRGFGGQASGDSANEGIYSWITGLNLFAYSDDGDDSNDDDAYVYKNMKDAYFMKAELNLDDIYGNGTFTNKFNEIKTTNFNLKDDANGLFYYNGAIKNLKISDKALGVIVKKKQNFSGSVAGAGMTAEIMSLKLTIDDADLVIESGIKIAFDGRSEYYSMPHYFFVISKTVRSWDDVENKYVFTTTLSMNNLLTAQTDELFQNITALESKGVKADSFNKADIENTINNAIKSAFENLPSSVKFGEFTSAEITAQYQTGAVYPVGCALPTVGSGYISFPSVYSYMIDLFYTSDKPEEEDMQHMILSLHSTTVADEIVTNEKSSTAYHVTQAYKGNNTLNDFVVIYSDKYLAHEISLGLSGENINGDISLANGIDQSIILRAGLGSAEWGDWEEKFFEDPSVLTYNSAHNYLIVTACVSLAGYASGNADLLPSDLYLSVLFDLDDSSSSKGLLYNMNHKDMDIFSYIMHKYNNQFVSVDDMAVQLAGIINTQLNSIKSVTVPLFGTVDLNLNYRLATDSFLYTNSLPYSAGAASDVSNEWNDDGVGYVILSYGAIA